MAQGAPPTGADALLHRYLLGTVLNVNLRRACSCCVARCPWIFRPRRWRRAVRSPQRRTPRERSVGGWGAGTRRGRIARTSQPTLHHKKGMHKLQHWSCGSDAPTEAGGVGDAAARRGSATNAFVPSAPIAVCAHVSFPTRPPGVPPTAMARCATTVEVFTPHHQRTSRRRASARRKRRPTTGLPARAGFSCLSDARANALQFWGALVRPGARRGM